MLADLERAKVVITNHRAFKLRDQDLEVQGPGVPLENWGRKVSVKSAPVSG